jgi:hypothetical protein
MKKKEFYSLKVGEKVSHKHYGICKVDDIIPGFGITIIPTEKEGLMLLRNQSGMPDGTPLLETSFTLITGKV